MSAFAQVDALGALDRKRMEISTSARGHATSDQPENIQTRPARGEYFIG